MLNLKKRNRWMRVGVWRYRQVGRKKTSWNPGTPGRYTGRTQPVFKVYKMYQPHPVYQVHLVFIEFSSYVFIFMETFVYLCRHKLHNNFHFPIRLEMIFVTMALLINGGWGVHGNDASCGEKVEYQILLI